MTLKELNGTICGFPERCWMIFKSEDDMDNSRNRVCEIWTPQSDGHGGTIDDWSSNPMINRQVASFCSSGWQSNVYYAVLK